MIKYILTFLLITPVYASSVYIDQIGDSNYIYVEQKDADGKNTNISNDGDLNILHILQQGAGSHTATISSTTTNNTNNNNLLEINQRGAGNHTATITLDNSSSNANNNDVKINQSGAANKDFNLTVQGSNTTFVGIQDSATVPDSASMTIQCLTPPCSGYSYTKH